MAPGNAIGVRARRLGGLASCAAAALAIMAGPASAHLPGEPTYEVTTLEQVGGETVQVSRHLDPLTNFTDNGQSTTAAVPAAAERAQSRSLASTCTGKANGTDDTGDAYFPSSSRVIKVIYAYPTDIGNRFATYAPVIQSGINWVAELVAGESGNRKSLRFDIGTNEGPACLDIQTVALTGPAAAYKVVPSQTFTLLRSELLPKITGQPGSRNFLVYADGINLPNVGGEAQVRSDDSVAGTQHGLGNLFAVLYGRGGTDFAGSATSFKPGTTSRTHVDLALHEISHTLGAVQPSAPHHSTAFHCLDEYDILCYDDDGAGGLSTYTSCNTPTSQYWDCNKDDYFNPAPAPGSYLATHWNLYNSAFMCPVAQCAPGGISGPPDFTVASDRSAPDTKIAKGPGKKTRDRTPTISFTSTKSGSSFACSTDGRAFAPCASPTTLRKLSGGRHRFLVYAIDGSQNKDLTPASASFKVQAKRKRR